VSTGADVAALGSLAHHSTRAPQQTLLDAIDSDAPVEGGSPDASAMLDAARRLPRELRAILRKALATDRADRYDSAAALADDVERWRERRPVKALPATRRYLARKFVVRHRLGLGAAGLVALALVVGTLLALRGLALARQEAAKSERVSDFVRSMLAGIDPERARGMDRGLMRLVLDSAAERAGRELAAQPDVRADIEHTIASSYSSLGEFALADAHRERTRARAECGKPLEGCARGRTGRFRPGRRPATG
jgi:non-specific serine/threonine protein kinase/serine/threonine-protein kinase